MFFCFTFFKILYSINRFRVSQFYEIIGIDLLMHSSVRDLQIQAFVMNDVKDTFAGLSNINFGNNQKISNTEIADIATDEE